MRLEDLALIGNCQFSALVAKTGEVAWCCLPRFDSDPVFSSLLDGEGGKFAIAPASGKSGEQRYLPNTNVLETRFSDETGSFRVLDFAPRFVVHERHYRPTMLVRVVEPLDGTPLVRVACDPRMGWTRQRPPTTRGSNHVDYGGFAEPLRLTSDVPVSYLGGQPFALSARRHLVLTWGAPVEESLAPLCHRFLEATVRYWQKWVKHCNIPPHYQEETIRSALALKLHCFEDTGAIVAAMTTSIPESPGSGRTWDYRYCWLRDAYYVLAALRLLGHFEEREQFTQYLLDIVGRTPTLELAPLYRIDGSVDLDERILDEWPGYENHGPVRVGNGAATHRQNDVFGELVLALAPVFLDDRFREERSPHALKLVEGLARKAIEVAGQPDAGIWEYRTAWQPQTFSSLMCWAAADRMALVAERHKPAVAGEFRQAASRIREEILARAWNGTTLVSTYGGADLDAALLQAVTLRFLPPAEPRLHKTVDAIAHGLGRDGWLFRYHNDDGFGRPEVAFVICTFWLVEALAQLGRATEARATMEKVRAALSPLGLVSEDFDPATRRMWGNFPQAYSHVGLIHAAFAASPRWTEIL
jgi:GH15 family glucan-1,4-alpha-glucosidase